MCVWVCLHRPMCVWMCERLGGGGTLHYLCPSTTDKIHCSPFVSKSVSKSVFVYIVYLLLCPHRLCLTVTFVCTFSWSYVHDQGNLANHTHQQVKKKKNQANSPIQRRSFTVSCQLIDEVEKVPTNACFSHIKERLTNRVLF